MNALKSFASALFDRGGLAAIFEHVRNVVVASFVVVAGFEATRRADAIHLLPLVAPVFVGEGVAAIGSALIVLNFIDGLRKLSRFRWHIGLQALLVLVYVFFSVRFAQLIILFRGHDF